MMPGSAGIDRRARDALWGDGQPRRRFFFRHGATLHHAARRCLNLGAVRGGGEAIRLEATAIARARGKRVWNLALFEERMRGRKAPREDRKETRAPGCYRDDWDLWQGMPLGRDRGARTPDAQRARLTSCTPPPTRKGMAADIDSVAHQAAIPELQGPAPNLTRCGRATELIMLAFTD